MLTLDGKVHRDALCGLNVFVVPQLLSVETSCALYSILQRLGLGPSAAFQWSGLVPLHHGMAYFTE
jgi:hypothetical protein